MLRSCTALCQHCASSRHQTQQVICLVLFFLGFFLVKIGRPDVSWSFRSESLSTGSTDSCFPSHPTVCHLNASPSDARVKLLHPSIAPADIPLTPKTRVAGSEFCCFCKKTVGPSLIRFEIDCHCSINSFAMYW